MLLELSSGNEVVLANVASGEHERRLVDAMLVRRFDEMLMKASDVIESLVAKSAAEVGAARLGRVGGCE